MGIYEFRVPCKYLLKKYGRSDMVKVLKMAIEVAARSYALKVPVPDVAFTKMPDITVDGPVHALLNSLFDDLLTQDSAVKFNRVTSSPPLSANSCIDISLLLPRVPLSVSPDSNSISWASLSLGCRPGTPLFPTQQVSYDSVVVKDFRMLNSALLERHPWLVVFSEDLLLDLYRCVPDHVLSAGDAAHHAKEVRVGDCDSVPQLLSEQLSGCGEEELWRESYVSLRASLRASEGAVSDVLHALAMAYDLYPTPEAANFASYVSARTELPLEIHDEGGHTSSGVALVVPQPDDDQLLCQGTRKRAKLASLLAASHEMHMAQTTTAGTGIGAAPPPHNLKEGAGVHPMLPQSFRAGIQRDGELANRMARLFGAHSSTCPTSQAESPEKYLSAAGPRNVRAARVESVKGLGIDGCFGGSSSGLPSNELQEFIGQLGRKKLAKRVKRSGAGEDPVDAAAYPADFVRLHASAVAAIGVVVEELASELMERWREGIRRRCEQVQRSTGPDYDKDSLEVAVEEVIGGPLAPLTQCTNSDTLELIFREAALQVRGMDLGDLSVESGDWNHCDALLILSNRLEVLFGVVLDNSDHKERLMKVLWDERDRQQELRDERRAAEDVSRKELSRISKHVRRRVVKRSRAETTIKEGEVAEV